MPADEKQLGLPWVQILTDEELRDMPSMRLILILERRAEAESFSKNILNDIEKVTEKLEKQIRNYEIAGDHNQANKAKKTLTLMHQVKSSMTRLLKEGSQ